MFSIIGFRRLSARASHLAFFCLALLCAFGATPSRASVSLSWDQDPDPTVAGYNMHYGTASLAYSQVVTVGTATTVTIDGLQPGVTYYFAVTAYNASGTESLPSNEVQYTTALVPVTADATVVLVSGGPQIIDVGSQYAGTGVATAIVTPPQYGMATVNDDGTITYIPIDRAGAHDSFQYQLSNSSGASVGNVDIVSTAAFSGLVSNASPSAQNTGRFQMALVPYGRFNGKMVIGSQIVPFSGVFQPDGTANLTLPVRGAPPFGVSLTLDQASAVVSGTIANSAGLSSALTAEMDPYSASAPTPDAGTYTLLLPSSATDQSGSGGPPQGTGFARIVVGSNGVARVTGRLADGTLLYDEMNEGADHTLGLFVPLYSGQGFLTGTLKFESLVISGSESDMDGVLDWQKPAGYAPDYAAGFDTSVSAVGSKYVAPASPSAAATALVRAQGATTVTFAGGSLASPHVFAVSAAVKNEVYRGAGTNPNRIAIRINRATGLMTGSFLDPSTGHSRSIAGAVFQKRSLAAGFFSVPGSSGSVLLSGSLP